MQALGWGFPVERFAWAAVEFSGHALQAFGSARPGLGRVVAGVL